MWHSLCFGEKDEAKECEASQTPGVDVQFSCVTAGRDALEASCDKVRTVKSTTDVKRSRQAPKAFGGASWLAMREAEGLYKPTESTKRGPPTALARRGVGPSKPRQEAMQVRRGGGVRTVGYMQYSSRLWLARVAGRFGLGGRGESADWKTRC